MTTPRAYRFQFHLEMVDIEDKHGGDVDKAFSAACQMLIDDMPAVLAKDINYEVLDEPHAVAALLALRHARQAAAGDA